MILKKFKPTTPSKRHLVQLKLDIFKKPLLKNKMLGLKKVVGRNNTGQITSFNKGSGHKKKYRKLDTFEKFNSTGIVCSIEYDPNRTANISAIFNINTKKYFYIISPTNLNVGDIVKTSTKPEEINLGNTLLLDNIPIGSFLYNICTKNNSLKSTYSKAAGSYSYLIEKNNKFCKIILSSGEKKIVSVKCFASIGIVSNNYKYLTILGKAGRSRWLNNRPKVRGVAMNPIDHPHGGGEGKTSGGRPSVSPWGKPTK